MSAILGDMDLENAAFKDQPPHSLFIIVDLLEGVLLTT